MLAVANDNAQKFGVADRLTLLPGSAFDTDWGGPYDIVLLTNFFITSTCQPASQLAAKAHAALTPGGRAVTLEFIPNADRVTPPPTADLRFDHARHDRPRRRLHVRGLRSSSSLRPVSRSEFHALPPTTQQAVVDSRTELSGDQLGRPAGIQALLDSLSGKN